MCDPSLPEHAAEIAMKVAEANGNATYSNENVLSQLGKLTEETGEAFGSYLRANGFSRRSGTFEEHEAELADVVITAYVIAACEEFDLDRAIEQKLKTVMTRGWKDEPSKMLPPLWQRDGDGGMSYLLNGGQPYDPAEVSQ